jgi:replicative DNA helicase Mcm
MYGSKSRSLNYLVTPNHRFFSVADVRTLAWKWETAEFQYGKGRQHMASCLPYDGTDTRDIFEIPPACKCATGDKPKVIAPMNMGDWCEFLGWYISEGCAMNSKHARYLVIISQCEIANPAKVKKISELLHRLNFNFGRQGRNFCMNSKALFMYLDNFGGCHDKYVPEFIFELRPEYRRRFLDAFLAGDGHETKSGNRLYSSASEKLIDGIERLLVMAGSPTSRGTPWSGKNSAGQHSSWIHRTNELTVKIKSVSPRNHYIQDYSGDIFCATVPGGLLLTKRGGCPLWSGNSVSTDQFGFLSSIEGPESERIGIDTRLAWGTKIGSDGKLYQIVYDRKRKKHRWVSPSDLADSIVKLPD